MAKSPDDPAANPFITSRSSLAGLGWQIASTLLLFTVGGYALDRWLNTLPWFLLGGSLVGMLSVFVQIYRIAKELDREERRKKAKKTADSASVDDTHGAL